MRIPSPGTGSEERDYGQRWSVDPAVRSAERLLDPEARLQHARDVAWRALNRRDRTVSELRDILAGKRVDPNEIDAVVVELSDGGYLDDAGYAQRFAEDRRRLDSWGAERIERRLMALGVASEHIAAAVGEQDRESELVAAISLLHRRFSSPLGDPRDRTRALGVLLRRGYEPEVAYEALRRHADFD